ncbi:MAG: pgk, partial [Geminicoccaceae bacterium]|nr:pgk [Geminicoccaceae bacterium]
MGYLRTLDDLDVAGRTVLVRLDLNVPMQEGEVSDASRIERSVPTVRELLDKGAKVVVLSHFGRPKGRRESSMSLRPLARPLGQALGGIEVGFAEDCVGAPAERAVAALEPGGVLLLENLRFHPGEEKNDPEFADQLARLGELYVDDAFSAAHRAHASITGLAERLPCAAGRLMQAEVEALSRALDHPERPLVALIGGAKISTKLELLGNL